MTLSIILLLSSLILCSAYLSLTEAAFLAVNKVRLRHLMQRGSPAAKIVYQLLTKLDQLIATLLIANNLINVIISVLATIICIRAFGEDRGPLIAAGALSIILLVAGEITPKLFAASHADRVALTVAWPTRWLIRAMRPLVWLFTQISHVIIRLLGGSRLPRSPIITEEELKVMIEMGREAGIVAEQELRLLHRIFEFDDTLVRDVMVPRDEIAGVEIAQPPERVLDVLLEEGHSRIPVYRGSLDQIVGIVYARDLLNVWRHSGLFVLEDLIRPAHFVPEHKRVAELLADFQRLKIQIALVRDAKGATLGLVTLEDLLEEIVGEIHEEIPG